MRLAWLCLACCMAPLVFARAQDPLQRWQEKSPQERAELLERFRELQQLAPEERAALEARAQGLQQLEFQVANELAPEERAQLEGLSPEERGKRLGERLLERAREKGARILGKLPPELLRSLDAAPPVLRAHVLEQSRHKAHEHGSRAAISRLCEKLGHSSEQTEGLRALPQPERMRALLSLKRDLVERDVRERGLPPEVEAGTWEALRALDDRDFADAWERLAPRDARLARRPVGLGLSDDPWLALDALLRPAPEDLAALASLPSAERKRRVGELVRERCLAFLRERELLAPEELEPLRALEGPQFGAAVRELVRQRLRERKQGR